MEEIKKTSGLSAERVNAIRDEIHICLGDIFTDYWDRKEVVDEIIDEVCQDINETADWSHINEDEYCISDIQIALARVLKKRIVRD